MIQSCECYSYCARDGIQSVWPLTFGTTFGKAACDYCGQVAVAKKRWMLFTTLMEEAWLNTGTLLIFTLGLWLAVLIVMVPLICGLRLITAGTRP